MHDHVIVRAVDNAQASTSALVNPEQFEWLSGKDSLISYVGIHGGRLQFCKICGSTLCTIFNGEIYQVTLGCITGDPGIELGMYIFVGSKSTWEAIAEGVPQYQTSPTE